MHKNNICGFDSALLTIADSIAIKVLKEGVILKGVGNELHLHSKQNEAHVLNIILKGNIHGIIKDDGKKVLVFGEKEFVLLEWNYENTFFEIYRAKLSDWISAASFLENGFVLVTAHSVLLHIKTSDDGPLKERCEIVERISCADKSTLYCAHIHGNNLRDLIVFGGNAFGELLIWRPTEKITENGIKISPLIQRFSAHNGVIFSIDYKPNEKLLTTTSDDRSTCFWNINFKTESMEYNIEPIAKSYGHQARVFQGKIINYDNVTYVVSVGEDSHFCLWRPNGELIYKKRIHFGAVIWNLEYEKATGAIYTVGSTGNMIVTNIRNILDEKLQTIPKKMTLPNALKEIGFLSKIKFLNECLLIGVTDRSNLVTFDFKTSCWKTLETFVRFKCTVIEVFKNYVALCGYKCCIILEHENGTLREIFNGNVLDGVIRSFNFLSEKRYLLSDELGNCILLEENRMLKPHHIELPKNKERWVTAALLINDELLLISNRMGNLMLYKFTIKNSGFELMHILKHPHGYLGITLLKLIDMNENFVYVKSAGHDGTLKILSISLKEAPRITRESHQVVPVAWIEESFESLDGTEVFLGFNDNRFVAWTEEHDTLLRLACGGGHRSWHYFIYRNETKSMRIKLIFLKNKNLLQYDMLIPIKFDDLNIISLYRNRWHTRPCNILEIIGGSSSGNDVVTLVSAGDDNHIKIAQIDCVKSSPKLYQKAEIHSHISNIRSLKVINIDQNKRIIFSGGGRAQICASLFDLGSFRISEILNYTLKESSNILQTTETQHNIEPDTRIMSLDVLAAHSNLYYIYVAGSDGFLSKIHFNSDCDNVSLDKKIYYGKCLLQVRLVNDLYLLTAATDGIVAFYNLGLTNIMFKTHLHSSGINALDIKYQSKIDVLQLVTGGDDQAVAFAKICIKDVQKPLLVEKLYLPKLHTAQVTATKFSKCGRYVYTTGVDQNLIKFDTMNQQIVSIIHSCIADVKGFTLENENNFGILYGCGLQIFKNCS